MFAPMRRRLQQLPEDRALKIFSEASAAVLALSSDDYPYAVPVSFVVFNGNIFIHGAPMGLRETLMKKHPKVSLCVIEKDEIIPEKLTTHFRSVIVFGTASFVTEPQAKREALMALAQKYSSGFEKEAQEEVNRTLSYVSVAQIKIEHITGKEAIELVNAK